MKRPSALSLLLVLLLAACYPPAPIAAPPQAATPQAQQRQEEPASAAAPPKLLDQALGQKLQAALEAAVASPDTKWPGAVLYVQAPGLGAWSGAAGLGAVETNTPMRPHDRFRAGSLTKPFIAAVVLQLVEEGRFALDDPITKLLPDQVAAKFADMDQITVRMLLNHTSGLPDFMDRAGPQLIAQPRKVWQAEELLDFAAGQKPMFAPGESQHYSNTNYVLLGMIIDGATGQPWREGGAPAHLRAPGPDGHAPARARGNRPAGRARPRLCRLRQRDLRRHRVGHGVGGGRGRRAVADHECPGPGPFHRGPAGRPALPQGRHAGRNADLHRKSLQTNSRRATHCG